MSIEIIAEKIKELNELKEKIASCNDDREAIKMQSKVVSLLQEIFGDKESLAKLALLNQHKNKKED